MKRLALSVIAGLVLLAGCGPTAPAHTGIAGRVFISGGPAPGITRPYPASKVEVLDAAGKVVAAATPRSDASFSIALPPGAYTVEAHATQGNPWFQPQKVSVRAGAYSRVDIYAEVP